MPYAPTSAGPEGRVATRVREVLAERPYDRPPLPPDVLARIRAGGLTVGDLDFIARWLGVEAVDLL